jgi:Flp pilus assembly pilin Flp
MRLLLNLLRDQRGVGAIEYVLVASLISVAAIAAFDELGRTVDDRFVKVEASMKAK